MEARKVLSKEDILNANDLQLEEVDVTREWGGVVMVKGLSGEEKSVFDDSLVIGDPTSADRKINLQHFKEKLVSLSIVDGNGNKLFTLDDVKALARKSSSAIEKIYAVVKRLNSIGQEEQMLKNL